MKQKFSSHWAVNVLSAILLFLLASTGLINWLLLPGRHGVREGFLFSLRHVLMDVHHWTALSFLIVVIIHALLHRVYIKAQLKAHGFLK